jgi:hypothetical protein
MELLLSACSTYDNKITLPGKQKLAVYTATTLEDEPDRYYNVGQDDGYAVYSIDTDISDILVNTSCFDNTSINSISKSTFLSRDEWNKLTQEQKDRLIAKRRQERMGLNKGSRKPFPSPRQVNANDVNNLVCIDDIIDYTIMHHEVNNVEV